MNKFCMLLGVLMCAPAHADVLPPKLIALQAQIGRAEKAAKAVEAELARQRGMEGVLDGTLRHMVRVRLQMGSVPEGVWQVQSMLTDTPDTPGLVNAILDMNGKALMRAQERSVRLGALYSRTLARRNELASLNQLFVAGHMRVQAEERAVLASAGLSADMLADELDVGLKQAMGAPLGSIATQTVRVPAGYVWPVVGRLVQGFHKGRGATAEGIVLQGSSRGLVKSPVAGTVLYAGPFRVFGGLVILKAQDGTAVLLGGLSGLSVDTGAPVNVGQIVGVLAQNGRLYWEMRRQGRVVNPLTQR